MAEVSEAIAVCGRKSGYLDDTKAEKNSLPGHRYDLCEHKQATGLERLSRHSMEISTATGLSPSLGLMLIGQV